MRKEEGGRRGSKHTHRDRVIVDDEKADDEDDDEDRFDDEDMRVDDDEEDTTAAAAAAVAAGFCPPSCTNWWRLKKLHLRFAYGVRDHSAFSISAWLRL